MIYPCVTQLQTMRSFMVKTSLLCQSALGLLIGLWGTEYKTTHFVVLE